MGSMRVLRILCQNPEFCLHGAPLLPPPRGRVVKVAKLKRSKSLSHLTAVGSSLALVTCEACRPAYRRSGGFSQGSPVFAHLTINSAKNE